MGRCPYLTINLGFFQWNQPYLKLMDLNTSCDVIAFMASLLSSKLFILIPIMPDDYPDLTIEVTENPVFSVPLRQKNRHAPSHPWLMAIFMIRYWGQLHADRSKYTTDAPSCQFVSAQGLIYHKVTKTLGKQRKKQLQELYCPIGSERKRTRN